ncbi:MAG TPA: hypothetical protein DCL77_07520 [Prolixibacteraceae bacterium]|nr:hypothetical protein [Prolixibacteraceae bacterium]
MKKLSPEDLQNEHEFELLTEVSHLHLREFVIDLISKGKTIIRIYSIYQVIMMILFAYILTRGIVLFIKGDHTLLIQIGLSMLFSVTALVVIHELLHALAYLATGARRISFGVIPRKFVFYAMADRQVIAPRAFHIIALTPFIIVKLICLWGIVQFYNQPLMYFFLSMMCLHSLFCAGDIAMLAFYRLYPGKIIYNFDNKSEGKTYFYARK